jgi:hypothetical protein
MYLCVWGVGCMLDISLLVMVELLQKVVILTMCF